MFDVFIFIDMEIAFTGREKVFCVLEYAPSQSHKIVQHAFVKGVLKTVANSNADLDMEQKILRGRLFVQGKRIWMSENIRRDSRVCL